MAPRLRSLLVPVDFSPCSEEAMRYAALLAEAFGATIEVLHVWELPVYAGTESVAVVHAPGDPGMSLSAFLQQGARAELDRSVASLRSIYPQVRGRLEAGDVHGVIVEASRGHDMIVMGTHGRRGISHILLGSVADRVVRHAHCPVLTVREGWVASPGRPG